MNNHQKNEQNDSVTFYSHHSNEHTARLKVDDYEQKLDHSPPIRHEARSKAGSSVLTPSKNADEPELQSEIDVNTIPNDENCSKMAATNSLHNLEVGSEIAQSDILLALKHLDQVNGNHNAMDDDYSPRREAFQRTNSEANSEALIQRGRQEPQISASVQVKKGELTSIIENNQAFASDGSEMKESKKKDSVYSAGRNSKERVDMGKTIETDLVIKEELDDELGQMDSVEVPENVVIENRNESSISVVNDPYEHTN